jgi:hypothetical protein
MGQKPFWRHRRRQVNSTLSLASVASCLGVPLLSPHPPWPDGLEAVQMQTIYLQFWLPRLQRARGKVVPSRHSVYLLFLLEHPGFQQGTEPLLTLLQPLHQ